MKPLVIAGVLWAGAAAAAEPAGLPLPPAPVQLVIPDAAAFDAALTGRFRLALTGAAEEGDPVVAAWRQSPVGSKLEDQWRQLSHDLPWTWTEIRRLRPRAVGLALLNVGALEAVLVIDTPLAALPLQPPAGSAAVHQGVAYRQVVQGAGDGDNGERRMGVAWARLGSFVVIATSERALRLAIDESLAGRGVTAPLAGLASVALDVTALRKDLYFRREFLWGDGARDGVVRAALRVEDGSLVEVREGRGEALPAAYRFGLPGDAESGWETDGDTLWPALRAALLEPLPTLLERPLATPRALPSVERDAGDAYLTDLRTPAQSAAALGEEGELARWKALRDAQRVAGWGHAVAADGARLLVVEWPAARDAELVALCTATLERRAGRVEVRRSGDTTEWRVGPGLPSLALRRTGRFVWFGPAAGSLAGVVEPAADGDVVRWARLDAAAVRAAGARWERIEGPASPERVRPLSDRLLGLLGWMPSLQRISLERRQTGETWTERLVLEGAHR